MSAPKCLICLAEELRFTYVVYSTTFDYCEQPKLRDDHVVEALFSQINRCFAEQFSRNTLKMFHKINFVVPG